jgi:hypothetical protein
VLPNAVVHSLIHYFFPNWSDECGFRAHCDSCGYPEMPRLYERSGFIVEDIQLRYHQSIYFKPFLPIYLVSLAYDLILWALDFRWLSSQLLVVARRQG